MCVDAHYSNPQFNACKLAEAMQITRRQLYREMDKLNTSPASFIREFRLRRALQFLESGTVRRVKDLCFLVGYENSETFSKHFIEYYGYRPSGLIRKQVAQNCCSERN